MQTLLTLFPSMDDNLFTPAADAGTVTTVDPSGSTPPAVPEHKPVASYLHTAVVVGIMVLVASLTATTIKLAPAPKGGPFAQYVQTIIWLWLLTALVAFGLRRHGVNIRE